MKSKNIYNITITLLFTTSVSSQTTIHNSPPNIVFIMVDQFRAQAAGYSGDKNVVTPFIDKLADVSINLKNAVSGMPVCTPYRASLLTGQYPLTNGVFMNDVMLDTSKNTIAKVAKKNGYNTGYIGKWHLDGHGRENFIPANRRQGFEYWKVLECTHDYNRSAYFSGNSDKKLFWEGYDAIAQSEDACNYIKEQSVQPRPFMLFISLGTPHEPYQTAPEKYRRIYENKDIVVNENVPPELREKVQKDLKGYYSHISALDDCIGKIWQAIRDAKIEDNTILVFTADHGDLLGAHGSWFKQQPYEESIRVPFLIHYPAVLGNSGKKLPALINSPDIMPTLLGLSNLPIPREVEGIDFSAVLLGQKKDKVKQTLISCIQPFGQWNRKLGGKEFRGIVTHQYTYVRDLKGGWLFFDNSKDPLQLNNLIGNPEYRNVKKKLDKWLNKTLRKRNDNFSPGMDYVRKWKYVVDETESVPYTRINFEGIPIN